MAVRYRPLTGGSARRASDAAQADTRSREVESQRTPAWSRSATRQRRHADRARGTWIASSRQRQYGRALPRALDRHVAGDRGCRWPRLDASGAAAGSACRRRPVGVITVRTLLTGCSARPWSHRSAPPPRLRLPAGRLSAPSSVGTGPPGWPAWDSAVSPRGLCGLRSAALAGARLRRGRAALGAVSPRTRCTSRPARPRPGGTACPAAAHVARPRATAVHGGLLFPASPGPAPRCVGFGRPPARPARFPPLPTACRACLARRPVTPGGLASRSRPRSTASRPSSVARPCGSRRARAALTGFDRGLCQVRCFCKAPRMPSVHNLT